MTWLIAREIRDRELEHCITGEEKSKYNFCCIVPVYRWRRLRILEKEKIRKRRQKRDL